MKIANTSVTTFSKENQPLFQVDLGEAVLFQTEDCFCGQLSGEDQLVSTIDFTSCNPAAGPVYVKGAEPGDVLVVDILDLTVAAHGFCCTVTDLGPLWDTCQLRTRMIPVENGVASFQGMQWRVNPMIGVIGTAPAEGSVPCGHPFSGGGNMDSTRICKGSRLYLPVCVPGALLQMGDLHASMGDGEISGTGIEIAGEVCVRLSLIKRFALNWPVTETPDAWYVNTCAMAVEDGIRLALHELQRLTAQANGWDATDTAIYLSMQGNVEINQCCMDSSVENVIRAGVPKHVGQKPLISP